MNHEHVILWLRIHHMANHTTVRENLTAGDEGVKTNSTRRNQLCIAKPLAVLCQNKNG